MAGYNKSHIDVTTELKEIKETLINEITGGKSISKKSEQSLSNGNSNSPKVAAKGSRVTAGRSRLRYFCL